MLVEWMHWLSRHTVDELLGVVLILLLSEGFRYALSKTALMVCDAAALVRRPPQLTYCPSVCAIVAGYNEAETIAATLASLWGCYPRLHIVVVDDGSTDGMAEAARKFARNHAGILVLSRPDRGGKSSAMNFARPYTQAEILVVVDADSHLAPNAIWEIVQPLRDPAVAAVSGAVVSRNPFETLCTMCQAYEYQGNIVVGRLLDDKLGILGIVSGAFGAFRRDAVEKVGGWDVGPPEDLDLVLCLRKSGYRIASAPYAHCLTEMPPTWRGLIRQRRRWDRSGVVRCHLRKHLDMANPLADNFRLGNFVLFLENWFFSLVCCFLVVSWFVWFVAAHPLDRIAFTFLTLYAAYAGLEVLQAFSHLYYSLDWKRDALLCATIPLMPLYRSTLLVVRAFAHLEEIFCRTSFEDNFVPRKVREATWKW